MFRMILLGFMLFSTLQVTLPSQCYAISLDDDEEDAEDVADLLEEAKRAGRNESFSKADELLKKAKMYGVSGSDVQETEHYVAQKKRAREARLERECKERERLARLKREREERVRRASVANRTVYITSWGYDFSGDDRIWGRSGIKLSNGSELWVALEKKKYGMRCYELTTGSYASASNCSNSINGTWIASCGNGSGQFTVYGNQVDAVKAIVGRCAR